MEQLRLGRCSPVPQIGGSNLRVFREKKRQQSKESWSVTFSRQLITMRCQRMSQGFEADAGSSAINGANAAGARVASTTSAYCSPLNRKT